MQPRQYATLAQYIYNRILEDLPEVVEAAVAESVVCLTYEQVKDSEGPASEGAMTEDGLSEEAPPVAKKKRRAVGAKRSAQAGSTSAPVNKTARMENPANSGQARNMPILEPAAAPTLTSHGPTGGPPLSEVAPPPTVMTLQAGRSGSDESAWDTEFSQPMS